MMDGNLRDGQKGVTDGTVTHALPVSTCGRANFHTGCVNVPSGRCEKIDLEAWSNFGLKKNRAWMPYKRPLDLRHTFRSRRNFNEIVFFTSSCHAFWDTIRGG